MVSCVWLLSHGFMGSGSIQLLACVRTSLIFMAEECSTVWIDMELSTHPLMGIYQVSQKMEGFMESLYFR